MKSFSALTALLPRPPACSQVDVSGAYESLPHSKLTEVVSEALSPFMDEPCTIRRYARIWAEAHEGLKRIFVRQVRYEGGGMSTRSARLRTETDAVAVRTGRFPGRRHGVEQHEGICDVAAEERDGPSLHPRGAGEEGAFKWGEFVWGPPQM